MGGAGFEATTFASRRLRHLPQRLPRVHNGAVFLIGMMGSGKTTVGKALARRLGLSFFDADQEITARSGVSIPTIFDIEGEAGFRRRERAVLAELARSREAVIATGGGAVLDPESRRLMRESGTVIYLNVSVEHLYQRTARDSNRPLLARSPDRRATLSSLLEARDPLYRETAHWVVEGGTASAASLATRIADAIERGGPPEPEQGARPP